MIRGFVKVLIVVLILVAVGAFFMGYRWGTPDSSADIAPAGSPDTTGTTGVATGERERAREIGAEIGDKVAAGANSAERALANGQLTAKIKSKMALDDMVRALAIDVDTNDGVVTLSGRVGSAAERERAVRLARETEGVTSVVDHLTMR